MCSPGSAGTGPCGGELITTPAAAGGLSSFEVFIFYVDVEFSNIVSVGNLQRRESFPSGFFHRARRVLGATFVSGLMLRL